MREGCSVLHEADFCYTIVKTRESQKKNAWSNRSAAETTTAQKKNSKSNNRKGNAGEKIVQHNNNCQRIFDNILWHLQFGRTCQERTVAAG